MISELSLVHEKVLQGLEQREFNVAVKPFKLLHKIKDMPEEMVSAVLQKAGAKLKTFVAHYDPDHRAVARHFSYWIKNGIDEPLLELFDLYSLTSQSNQKFPHIFDLLKKLIFQSPQIGKVLEDLFNVPCRALKTREDRDFYRKYGKHKFDHKGEELPEPKSYNPSIIIDQKRDFNILEVSFVNYVRNASPQADIRHWNELVKKFVAAGLPAIADAMNSNIVSEKQHTPPLCKFNKISLSRAAVLLGLMHGFRLEPPFTRLQVDSQVHFLSDLLEQIHPGEHLSRNLRENFSFGYGNTCGKTLIESAKKHEVNIEDIIKHLLKIPSLVVFDPRVYPLHVVEDIASDETKTTINKLEQFKDFLDMSLFDNYYVVLPTVSIHAEYMTFNSKLVYSASEFGTVRDFNLHVDRHYLENKMLTGALVGSSDNEYYFIDYFLSK